MYIPETACSHTCTCTCTLYSTDCPETNLYQFFIMRVNYKLVWISSIYMYTTLQEDRLVCGPASVWNCVQWTLVLTCTVESNPHTPAMQEEAAPCRPRLWQVLNHTKCLFTFQPERTLLNWTHFMKIKVLMVAKSYALIWWKSVWALTLWGP